MNIKLPFQDNKIGSLLKNIGIVVGGLLLLLISYFYIYLPGVTHHNNYITVPDLYEIDQQELHDLVKKSKLRYSIEDSAYSADIPPYTVLRQFPKAGAQVKEGRIIYITINRVTPPTMPIPDLIDRSLLNAEVVLVSNELKKGRVIYQPNPFPVVMEMRYRNGLIKPGTRVPKGAVIDLVIGDGAGSRDFTIGDLIGDSYDQAVFKLNGWNLHLGNIEIAAGIDTTGIKTYVYKQHPEAGDSVKVGDPVNLWIGPKDYKEEKDN